MHVVNLQESRKFFENLGFAVYEPFTSENSVCLIIGKEKFVMLTPKERYQEMVSKPLADKGVSEMLVSLGCESKDIVNRITKAALAQGAKKLSDPDDNGFMYSWNFEDLDGHIWDLFWMDPTRLPK
jgi:predicted lactoylglutathione lyase